MMRNKDAVLAIFGPYIRQNCAKTDIYPLQKNKDRYRLRVPVKLRSQAGGALYIYGYTQKEVWRKAAEVFCDKKNSTVGAVYEAYHNETLADHMWQAIHPATISPFGMPTLIAKTEN